MFLPDQKFHEETDWPVIGQWPNGEPVRPTPRDHIVANASSGEENSRAAFLTVHYFLKVEGLR